MHAGLLENELFEPGDVGPPGRPLLRVASLARLVPKVSSRSGWIANPVTPAMSVGHQAGRSAGGTGLRSTLSVSGAGAPEAREPRKSPVKSVPVAAVWSVQSQYGTVTPGTSAWSAFSNCLRYWRCQGQKPMFQ